MRNNTLEWTKIFHEQINLFIGGLVAAVVSAIVIFFKKLPRIIKQKTRRKVIIHDLENLSKGIACVQDEVDRVGAIYGYVIKYHNHGPEKMTVLFEVTGHPCSSCVNQCSNYSQIRRLQADWIERPIHPYWLNNMCLKTIKLNGQVNSMKIIDIEDDFQKQILNDANINEVREVLIKAKGIGEFLTLALCFCSRFKAIENIDARMTGLSTRLFKIL